MKHAAAPPTFKYAIALLLGMACGSVEYPALLAAALVVAAAAAGIGALGAPALPRAARTVLVLLVVGSLGCAYSVVRGWTAARITAESAVSSVRAVVVSEAAFHDQQQQLYLDLPDEQPPVRVRATIRSTTAYPYGTVLLVDGTLQPPRPATETFDEAGFLRAHGAAGRFAATRVEAAGGRIGNRLVLALHDLRSWLLGRLAPIAQPERQIVAGVLLGDTAALPERLNDAFVRTGTTHILVASGANVAIIAWMAERLFRLFGVRAAILMTTVAVVAFAAMAGGEASIVRAAVLYVVLLVAKLFGRRIHQPTVIALVALLMMLWNPWSALFNPSFQLSFAAILGLIVFSDWIAAWLPFGWLKEFLAPTLAAELATLPILLFSFGQLSIVSPVVNVLALPLVPPIMTGGLLTLAVPWPRAVPWVTEGITTLLLSIVGAGAALPWAAVETDAHRLLATALAIGVLAAAVWLRVRYPREREADV